MKNSKNIYLTWVNETDNYCDFLGKGNMNFIGMAERVLNTNAPGSLQKCPIKVGMVLF